MSHPKKILFGITETDAASQSTGSIEDLEDDTEKRRLSPKPKGKRKKLKRYVNVYGHDISGEVAKRRRKFKNGEVETWDPKEKFTAMSNGRKCASVCLGCVICFLCTVLVSVFLGIFTWAELLDPAGAFEATPVSPPDECGNGRHVYPEVCDDGNMADNDGCESDCASITLGWDCTGGSLESPSICSVTCGDGRVIEDEVCDDGNTENGDGCHADCMQLEEGFDCTVGTVNTRTVCTDIDGCVSSTCLDAGDARANCSDLPAPDLGFTCICSTNYTVNSGVCQPD
jgi:cysteine-rich repeat protein